MKTNEQLGYERIAKVGGLSDSHSYAIGQKNGKFRGYGAEYYSDQDASKEYWHHEVCGRGDTAEEAVRKMFASAVRSAEAGGPRAPGLTRAEALSLQDDLLEELAELEELADTRENQNT